MTTRPKISTRSASSKRSPGDPNTGVVLLVALILALIVGLGGVALRVYVASLHLESTRTESTR